LTTQWCFGAPLIDRSFKISGGACAVSEAARHGDVELSKFETVWTNAECKAMGGTWSGGIDISGHVFLLVLGSAVLWMETLPYMVSSYRKFTTQPEAKGGQLQEEGDGGIVHKIGMRIIVTVLSLMWWMLLMTAAFFHTWTEKLAGLLVALFGIFLVYFLPRISPSVKSVLGVPGSHL
jgi:Inositol phospholipid synthesis and fat-storage-inducing TM